MTERKVNQPSRRAGFRHKSRKPSLIHCKAHKFLFTPASNCISTILQHHACKSLADKLVCTSRDSLLAFSQIPRCLLQSRNSRTGLPGTLTLITISSFCQHTETSVKLQRDVSPAPCTFCLLYTRTQFLLQFLRSPPLLLYERLAHFSSSAFNLRNMLFGRLQKLKRLLENAYRGTGIEESTFE